MEEVSVSEIADEILAHLRRHPQAQDTLEGIGQWWLPAQRQCPAGTIKDALDELVDAGLITELLGTDAQISYRMTNEGALKSIDSVVAAGSRIDSGTAITPSSSLVDEKS
jgi:hypothetical protein